MPEVPSTRIFLHKHHQIVEQPSPDSSKLLNTRQLQGGSAQFADRQTPLDSYWMILTALYIDSFSHHIHVDCSCYAHAPVRQYVMMVSVLYWKKKKESHVGPVSSVSYHLSSFSDVHYFVFGVQHATMEGVFPCSFSLLKRLSHSILKIPSLISFCRTLLCKIASTDVNDGFKISVFKDSWTTSLYRSESNFPGHFVHS